MPLKLYTYWRSSAAFRVRIALNLKALEYESIPVHLVRDGGEQSKAAYLAKNPQGLVPALADGELVVAQSLAICEYLEETHPLPALLPLDPAGRAIVRGMALAIACDVHPLNNLRVVKYLRSEYGQDDAGVARWTCHWIDRTFVALEAQIARYGDGAHCYGTSITLADVFLVPQAYNARRFKMDLGKYPRLAAVAERLEAVPAFEAARPEQQGDAK